MRVLGIPVRVDASALIVGGLVAWVYVQIHTGLPTQDGRDIALGAALAAVGFFLSLLAHEMGHALASRFFGIPVHGVTLFFMGGVTESAHEARRPLHDFVIVGLGPLLSLIMAGVFFLLGGLAPRSTVGLVGTFLAQANVVLAVFNVLPGYPLDGGRLLRAILWAATGRPHAATRWAARVGQGFAVLLGLLGVYGLVTGGGFGGLWEIMLAFFLWRGAAQSHARAGVREILSDRTARDAMGSVPPTLEPDASLSEALEAMQDRPSLLWPVGEPLVGALTLAQIDAVPDVAWHDTTLRQVALPLEAATVPADTRLDDAALRLRDAPGHMLLVVEDGRAVGLLTPSLVGFGDE